MNTDESLIINEVRRNEPCNTRGRGKIKSMKENCGYNVIYNVNKVNVGIFTLYTVHCKLYSVQHFPVQYCKVYRFNF